MNYERTQTNEQNQKIHKVRILTEIETIKKKNSKILELKNTVAKLKNLVWLLNN